VHVDIPWWPERRATFAVEVDGEKLMQFVFRAVDEVGATLNAALVVMGDKLGLYRALAGTDGLTPAELAERTGTAERYVREWLLNQAAGGYIDYDPQTGRYVLPDEQAVALQLATAMSERFRGDGAEMRAQFVEPHRSPLLGQPENRCGPAAEYDVDDRRHRARIVRLVMAALGGGCAEDRCHPPTVSSRNLVSKRCNVGSQPHESGNRLRA